MASERIPIARPTLGEAELRNVLDCVESTWISSRGDYIQEFESRFRGVAGAEFAVSCNTGTAALHLALLASGIGPGDEVLVPTLTYIASANVVSYCGAQARFVDSDPDTWNLDPADVERKINSRTRAMVAVHLFGQPADMSSLRSIAEEHNLTLVEDAAEAHGAMIGSAQCGSLGDVSAFSFYGNKIITTGEGGMVTTDDADLAERALILRGQGQSLDRTYWFPVIGYNYRMTNIEAALGVAQLERLPHELARRKEIALRYRKNLEDIGGLRFQSGPPGAESANWMVGVVLPVSGTEDRDRVAGRLSEMDIETRPFFYPLHTLPPYKSHDQGELEIAENIASRGLCLPTWGGLSDPQVDRVSQGLRQALARH